MSKQQSTHTLRINGQLGNIEQVLKTAQSKLANFMKSGEAPKGLEKAFEKVNTLLGQITDKAKKPLNAKGLTSVGSDIGNVEKQFQSIVRLLGEFEDLSDDLKISFLTEKEQKKALAAIKALEEYGKVLKVIQKEEKAVAAAQRTADKNKDAVSRSQKRVNTKQASKDKKKIELEGKQGELDAALTSGASPEKIAKLKGAIASLTLEITNLDKELSDANAALTQAQTLYDSSVTSLTNLQNQAQATSQNGLSTLKNEADKLGVSLEGLDGKSAAEQMELLSDRILDLKNGALKGGKAAFDQVKKGCSQAGDAARQMGEDVEGVLETVKENDDVLAKQKAFQDRIKDFLGLAGAAKVLRSSLSNAMRTIKDLDASMTEMAVVTELGVSDYWDQLPQYTARANEMGLAINDVYQADMLFYQQGLKTEEVVAISTETMKMARIANLDTAEATDRMTAALRGFNMELNQTSAQKVADVYSELAAITAADTDGISVAMTKTASIASSAGMEFETTAAFLSQIIETTRESAETAGTAMKTIIARFQELKKDPNMIGEVDGEIVDANKIEGALRTVGVSLRDSSGQFRDLDDVFLELAGKWDTLDKNTQRYIATIAAGSRQQSRFLAMMSDYGRTQELVTAANNSNGASQKQFGKTLESVASKLAKLKNAWDEFTMGILESDLVKAGIDILTKFLEVLNNMTSMFNGLAGSFVKISTVISLFKMGGKIFGSLGPKLLSIFNIADQVKQKGVEIGNALAAGVTQGFNQTGGLQQIVASQGTTAQSSTPTRSGQITTPTQPGQTATGKIGHTKMTGIGGRMAQGGIGVMNTLGIGHFKDADTYRRQHSEAKKIVGGNRREREENRRAYESNKQKLSEYSIDRQGRYHKKGSKAPIKTEKAQKDIEKLTKETEKYEKANEDLQKSSKGMWSSISDGISSASTALIGLGMGFGALGSAFEAAGMDGMAETFQTLSQISTTLGSVMGILPPIISLITALFPGMGTAGSAAGAEATTGGVAASSAWSIVGIVILAVMASIIAILAVILVVMAIVNNNSPEKKLEKASAAADAAAEAANNAAEAYDNLKQSLDNLDGQYKQLEELIKGTEEWNQKVQEVNQSVLDLIEQYPELAGLVKNEDGVLKIDLNSQSVQDILGAYKTREVLATSTSLAAKGDVSEAKIIYEADKLGDEVFSSYFMEPEDVRKLASAYARGEAGESLNDIANYIETSGIAMGSAAHGMAKALLSESEKVLEAGMGFQTLEDQMDTFYIAMAESAKQLINLDNYSEQEQAQMTTVFDEDLMDQVRNQRENELEKEYQNRSNTEEFNQMKNEYAKDIYGVNARVDGNKILNEAGEVLHEFDSEDEFAAAMASAQATKEAAEAMAQIPDIIKNSIKSLGGDLQDTFHKAFAGKDLTTAELTDFKEQLGTQITDETTGDTIYSGINDMWNNLTDTQKKVYGLDTSLDKDSDEYKESLKKAKKAYEDTFIEIVEEQERGFEKAIEIAGRLEVELSDKIAKSSAQAWMMGLESIAPGATSEEISQLNSDLDSILGSLTSEQREQAMSEINAIDKTDKKAWDDLLYRFKELGLMANISQESMLKFIESGKEASNAIEKINFDTLAQEINDIYLLLEKIKQGGRIYSEEDYQSIIDANEQLVDSFIQIGEEFYYVGSSIRELEDIIAREPLNKLTEASRQLKSKTEMSRIISEDETSIDTSNYVSMANYVNELMGKFASQGLSINDLEIEGLSDNVRWDQVSMEKLQSWIDQIEVRGDNLLLYENDYSEKQEKANVLGYTFNDPSYNAEMAVDEEYGWQHQQALLAQAVQSGGVNEALIEQYKEAIEEGDEEEILKIGKEISKAVDAVVEENQNRDAYKDLVNQVEEALISAQQKQIDKLSEINDSVNDANSKLISKIQEQIDAARQQRELDERKESLTDTYAQQAYLEMDTSGTNAMTMLQNQQAIEDAETELQDTLVDQALQSLEDANERAAEQRERQIELMTLQLETQQLSGEIADRAAGIVATSMEQLKDGTPLNQTIMGNILKANQEAGLGALEKQDWASSLYTIATQAYQWFTSKGITPTKINGNLLNDGGTDGDGGGQYTDKGSDINSVAQDQRNAAVQAVSDAASVGHTWSRDEFTSHQDYKDAYNKFKGYGGTDEEWNTRMGQIDFEANRIQNVGIEKGWWSWNDLADGKEETGWVSFNDSDSGTYFLDAKKDGEAPSPNAISQALNIPQENATGKVIKWKENYYILGGNFTPYRILSGSIDYSYFLEGAAERGFKTGGLADFTGPAWLDGTPSRPEYVLNAAQTERFFSLIDVLENYNTKGGTDKSSGDNYFDIAINVEKLESDYDVQKVADKIRQMIVEDATYRNVNVVNKIR